MLWIKLSARSRIILNNTEYLKSLSNQLRTKESAIIFNQSAHLFSPLSYLVIAFVKHLVPRRPLDIIPVQLHPVHLTPIQLFESDILSLYIVIFFVFLNIFFQINLFFPVFCLFLYVFQF